MLRKFTILTLLVVATLGLLAQNPEIKARVKGLENNKEYMELLHQEKLLERQSDSIQQQVAVFRQEYRTDTLNRAARAVQILEIEEVLFDLRDRLGELSNRINIIEQDWILQHLNDNVAEAPADTTATEASDSVKSEKAEAAKTEKKEEQKTRRTTKKSSDAKASKSSGGKSSAPRVSVRRTRR